MTTQEADAKCSELFKLMKPHVATNVMQRVNLYVVNKSGKKLPEFIATAAPEEKGVLINELIEIVTKGEWEKLPVVPNGQASTNGHKTPVVIAPTPAPRVPVSVPALTPAPVPPPAPVTPPPALTPAAPKLAQVPAPISGECEEDEDDPLAIITAQLAKLTKPAGKTITEEDCRKIVRNELAVVFKTIFEVLAKK